MANVSIERGIPSDPRRETKNQKERPFITENDEFGVVNFGQRVMARFRLTKNGPEILSFEELTTDDERKAEAERIFIETVGPLIDARLELTAARRIPGAEVMATEMLVNELTTQFDNVSTTMYQLGALEKDLEGIITDQSKQITRGETQIGVRPSLVRAQTTRLIQRAKRLDPNPPNTH